MSSDPDIAIAAPVIDEAEIAAVVDVLRSKRLTQGPVVAEFERQFAAAVGTKHAVAVSSGTAALHTALAAAGIGRGDEVITTPFSFIATANSVLMQGGNLRFVDIDPETFCLGESALEQAISPGTRAVIAAGLYGQPFGPKIATLTHERGIPLIEDAAQTVGAALGSVASGAIGDVGCFSLYATKNIMCGEGGVLTTDDGELAERAARFRQHGMTGSYEYDGLGYNYRLTDLAAAIAIQQLRRLADLTAKRRSNAEHLRQALSDVPGIVAPHVAAGRTHVWHQFTVRVTAQCPVARDELLRRLRADGISAMVYYPSPLHLVPHLRTASLPAEGLPHAEQACREVLSLPVHASLTEQQLDRIADRVQLAAKR